MEKIHLGARIERTLLDRIDGLTHRGGCTKTDAIEKALQVGLAQLVKQELDAGFALLGDLEMQDMRFPTSAQLEVVRSHD